MSSLNLIIFLILIIPCNLKSELISTNLSNSSSFTVVSDYNARIRQGITNNLSLESGKQLIIHGINVIPYNNTIASYAFVRAVLPAGDTMEVASVASGSGFSTRWVGPVLGPMTIQYGLNPTSSYYYDFEQTRCSFLFEIKEFRPSEVSNQNIPSASVVVPANATGDVDVLLEQSTDMITWTQCLPGTYNASTQKRFFRVRAVEK